MSGNNILCLGAGYVGGPTMAVIAEHAPHLQVTVADLNKERIEQWNSDRLPIYEPGLHDIVTACRGRNLHFKLVTPELINQADIIFVSVNTPTKDYGRGAGMAADLRYWELAARDILKYAKDGAVIVEKSTVPVKTAEAISKIINSGTEGKKFQILSNPEFLAEGTAVRDLENPDRILIGSEPTKEGQYAANQLADIYATWVAREKILLTNVWSSELSKLVANAMLAQRVSSMNSISALCEITNADIKEISRSIGMDSRIGPKFLEAGVGFGGSCFRKDILNLSYICTQLGLKDVGDYWKSVVDMNDYQINRFVDNVLSYQFNTVAGKRQAVFGFAFKPDTNDTRDSPAFQVCRRLLDEHAHIVITDPKALEHAKYDLKDISGNIEYEIDPYKAAENAHAIIVNTHWKEFQQLDYERIFKSMQKPAFIFDGRTYLDADKLYGIGFNLISIGKRPMLHI